MPLPAKLTSDLVKALLPWILGAVLLGFGAWKLYDAGHDNGAAEVQALWDTDKAKYEKALADAKADYEKKEEAHRATNRKISNDLAQAKLDHANALADQRAEFDRRMRLSSQRAAVYQRQAESGAAGCSDLAEHTARLDASLEEGRQLVRELGSTLGLREQQLRSVGQQLLNDRALFTDQGTTTNERK